MFSISLFVQRISHINNDKTIITQYLYMECRKNEIKYSTGQIQTLTLRVPLVPSILEGQAHRTIMPCTVLPVGDDLS